MPFNVSIDDNNTTLIHYQGVWTNLSGSTRQWEGGVHATNQAGASATFAFRGYQVWVLGTIPGGTGINSIDVSVDGGTASAINHTSNGTVVYNELYFASPLLLNGYHTIVVTNQGSSANGNSDFMLDRFLFETGDEVPVFSTIAGTSTSTSTSTANPSSSSSAQPSTSQVSSSHTKWGAIIGVVVACLGFLIVVLLFLLWKKTSKNNQRGAGTGNPPKPLVPTPFPLTPTPPTRVADGNPASPLPPPGPYGRRLPQNSHSPLMSEKDGYQHYQQDPATSPTTLNLYPTTGVFMSSSTAESPPAIASDFSAPIPRQNEEGSHPPDSSVFPEVPRRPSSLDNDKYEQPPPSYWCDS